MHGGEADEEISGKHPSSASSQCSKFDICGSVQQSYQIGFQAVDNKRRQNATFVVTINDDKGTVEYEMVRLPQPENVKEELFAYEYIFDAQDSKVGFLIMEVDVIENGEAEQISQSPFRLEVEERDCKADTGEDLRVPDVYGNCVCESQTLEIGSQCVKLSVFIPAVIVPIVIVAGLVMFCYLLRKRRAEDMIWKINSKELTFDDPPVVLGKGRFGCVYLGKYRGTEVAVKQLLDPNNMDDSDRSLGPISYEGGKLVALPTAKTDNDIEQFPDDSLYVADIGIQSCLYVQERQRKTSSQGSGFLSIAQSVALMSSGGNLKSNQGNLIKEMRLLSKLRHPNVVTIMGCTEDHRLVMEHMELGAMNEVLRSTTMLIDDAKILGMVQDVARGLHFLHATDPFIIHGDLKVSAKRLITSHLRHTYLLSHF